MNDWTHIQNQISRIIKAALLGEVMTTPKPGLVDKNDSGAHHDMDWHTFVASTYAIAPYLEAMMETGYASDRPLSQLFSSIRTIGVDAELAMLQATGGINTHKGMIFSMGTAACAAGWYYRKHQRFQADPILKLCGVMTEADLQKDFERMNQKHPKTSGERLYFQYGEKGIRGEVQQGFPSIRHVSLPLLKRLYAENKNRNAANINALLSLMASVSDTNILNRSTYEELLWVQRESARILELGGALTEPGMAEIRKMNHIMTEKHISPGGCADLLAVTLFCLLLEDSVSP
ncbi:MAG: triphosphoribosyl-dephospho-CoA synthase CitG [Lachnospiraceae bacterium]